MTRYNDKRREICLYEMIGKLACIRDSKEEGFEN
jgi:hypothetical protein